MEVGNLPCINCGGVVIERSRNRKQRGVRREPVTAYVPAEIRQGLVDLSPQNVAGSEAAKILEEEVPKLLRRAGKGR